MGTLKRLFSKRKIKISDDHTQEIDPFYSDIDIEQIGIYQIHFNRIIEKVDVSNYTKWSMGKDFNKTKLESDDEWIIEQLLIAAEDGINGALLQNMVNQYFFADILQRQSEKSRWISRVIHRNFPDDYFPDGNTLRKMMELLSL